MKWNYHGSRLAFASFRRISKIGQHKIKSNEWRTQKQYLSFYNVDTMVNIYLKMFV